MSSRAALHRLPLRPPFSACYDAAFRISSLPQVSPRVSKYRVCGIQSEAKLESATKLNDGDHSSKTWKIKMLYDGECPLCLREVLSYSRTITDYRLFQPVSELSLIALVNMLKERNRRYGAIKFVDISSNDYSSEKNEGLDYRTAMGRIHAILSDGTVLRDVDAFRRLYEEVGLGWVYAITKYKPIATVANAIYGVWAKYRLQIVGRPSLEDILESRKKPMGEEACSEKACKSPK